MITWLIILGSLAWVALLLSPFRSWLNDEVLEEAGGASARPHLRDISVLIPARNEAAYIADTLDAILAQSPDIHVLVADDGSNDDTATIVREYSRVTLIECEPRPPDWSGKMWALDQALQRVDTSLTLLLDADIRLGPGVLAALVSTKERQRKTLVSAMARLRTKAFVEQLLMPAFVFFFKQLYPFQLVNTDASRVAAAAGGCILVDTAALRDIGAFASLRREVIDDCALAAAIKRSGGTLWLGLGRGVSSRRRYDDLGSIWTMVERTAFVQLRRSVPMVLACTLIMAGVFLLPVWGVLLADTRAIAAAGMTAMFASYQPILAFYRQNPLWAVALPVIGLLYLLMTVTSAWRGTVAGGSEWKGRTI